jgi:ABC-type multidrug transport system fused ATPase/permease subunit
LIDIDSGNIYIDDVDIYNIGIETLRSKISIISQDSFLFNKSLRENIDPFYKYTDEQIWNSLEASNLKERVLNMKNKLDEIIDENGDNLSIGEKQLISIILN